jgi:hypothetical protein
MSPTSSSTTLRFTIVALCATLAVGAAACGDGGAEASDTSALTATSAPSEAAATTATTPTAATSTSAPPTTTDESWKQQAAAFCAAYIAEPPPPDWATAGIVAYLAARREYFDSSPSLEMIDLPAALRAAPTDVMAVWRQADEKFAAAEAAAAGGDLGGALIAEAQWLSLLQHAGALLTLGGAECGDPARADNAALNVSLGDVHHVATGFGSVWAAPWFGTAIYRVDPATGEVLATIDVGAPARRMQPADGRMIVRTTDAYVGVDPATNMAVATLPKADVGPFADRAAAVDGTLWICDGQRLHRYDPTTFQPSAAAIELGVECGSVTATTDLAVAFSYNEQPGESGTSAAAFLDPVTNQPLATIGLPSDVTTPLVLDDVVFFPAQMGSRNVVVDRATWTVSATPDYGREIGGAVGGGFDGRSIYLLADGIDVIVVDATTYELTGTIEPLTFFDRLNALAVGPGALWVATGSAGILERFDIPA